MIVLLANFENIKINYITLPASICSCERKGVIYVRVSGTYRK